MINRLVYLNLTKEEITYIFKKYLDSMYIIQQEITESQDMDMRLKCASNIMFINNVLANIDSMMNDKEKYKYLIEAIKYLEPRFEIWSRGRNR